MVNLPNRGVLGKGDSYFDPGQDFSHQLGRVSDYDKEKKNYKIRFENNNIKFLKNGDVMTFHVVNRKKGVCRGQVRAVEDFHIVVEVPTLEPCWDGIEYFRRGTILSIKIPSMSQRLYEASSFRKILIQRKADFLEQMKNLNNFLYNYDQERVGLIVNYDERIAKVMEEKKKAVRALEAKRRESYDLRMELGKKLDKLDRDIRFYRIERQETLIDRWNLSHDSGLPLGERPWEKR